MTAHVDPPQESRGALRTWVEVHPIAAFFSLTYPYSWLFWAPAAFGYAGTAGTGISQARVDEVLDQVDLAGAADRRVSGYSLGMRQRLGLQSIFEPAARPIARESSSGSARRACLRNPTLDAADPIAKHAVLDGSAGCDY